MVKRKSSGINNMNPLIKEIEKRILILHDNNEIDNLLSSDKFDEIDIRNLYYGRINDEIENLKGIIKKLKNDYPELII